MQLKLLRLAWGLCSTIIFLSGGALKAQCTANADFDFTPVNAQCAPTFINFSSISQPGVIYRWDFDNGLSPSSEANPRNIRFDPIGEGPTESFSVSLTVEDTVAGCSATVTKPVIIQTRPEIILLDEFGAPIEEFQNCSDAGVNPVFTINFTDGSRTASGSQYRVDWGDNKPIFEGNSPPTTHTYDANGIYIIAYRVTHPNGCVWSKDIPVFNISSPAVAVGKPANTEGCGPREITFPIDVLTVQANDPSTIYIIDPGDGTQPDTILHPPPSEYTYTYTQSSCMMPGQSFTFTITASNGCTPSTATVFPIKIFTAPKADFELSTSQACTGQSVSFINNTSEGFNSSCGNNTRYEWDFGDGSEPAILFDKSSPSHPYTSAGVYPVTLTASNPCGSSTITDSIEICEGAPTASFLAGTTNTPSDTCNENIVELDLPNDGCFNGAITIPLRDASMEGIGGCPNNYLWEVEVLEGNEDGFSFSNGRDTSRSINEEVTFTAPGVCRIIQTVSNICGSRTSCILVVLRSPPPNPVIIDLDMDTTYCLGDTIDVNTSTEGDVNAYTWAISGINGTPSPSLLGINRNVSDLDPISGLPAGEYEISLKVENDCGTDSTFSQFRIVDLSVPVIDTLGNIPICKGSSVILEVPDNLDTYKWFLNGDSIPGADSANYEALEPGNYSVEVGLGGCTISSSVVNVTIDTGPIVDAGTTPPVCISASPFILTGQSPVGGVWSGSPAISSEGLFTPSLAIEGENVIFYTVQDSLTGCESTDSLIIMVNALPTVEANLTLNEFCDVDEDITLTGFSPPGGTWTGDGIVDPSGVFNPRTAGGVDSYTLFYTFNDSSNCTNLDSVVVNVILPEVAEVIDSVLTQCQNEGLILLNGLATPPGGTWILNDTLSIGETLNPSDFEAGSYEIKYTFGTGTCENSDSTTINILAPPLVNIEPVQRICEGTAPFALMVNVTNNGSGLWSGSPAINPEGIFNPSLATIGANEVIYQFTDTITNCSNSDTIFITLDPLPETNFGADAIYCVGESIVFPNNTPSINGYTFSYIWDFGDGTTSNEELGQHQYDTTGNYNVTLRVTTNPGNCDSTFIQDIQVVEPPVANFITSFDPANACGETMVQFLNQSNGIDSLTSLWDFGNGRTSIDENPLETFEANPLKDTMYIVTLTVNQVGLGGSCASTQYKDSIQIRPFPNAAFIPIGDFTDPICSGFPLPLDNFSFGEPTRFEWDFGDGSPILRTTDTSVVTHRFFYEGDTDTCYTVTLRAFSDCGVDSTTRKITVLPNMVSANFNLTLDSSNNNNCEPLLVRVESNQSGFNKITWDFGDGTIISNGPIDTTHIYQDNGIYDIKLKIENGCNLDSSTISIEVSESPEASFLSPDALCLGEAFNFINTSNTTELALWDFGNGEQFAGPHPPPKEYDTSGIYQVILEAIDPINECVGRFSKEIEVIAPPIPGFMALTNVCAGKPIEFTNTSLGASEYLWDFGEPNPNPTSENPSHTFSREGTFIVKLKAFNTQGCVDSVSRTITVRPQTEPSFRVLALDECPTPSNFDFENTTLIPPLSEGSFIWDFGNGNTFSGSGDIPTQTYVNLTDSSLFFIVTLTAINAVGCDNQTQTILEVCPTPCDARVTPPNAFTPNEDGMNDTFRPVTVATRDYQLLIFNRWGEQLFSTNNPDEGWNGIRDNGQPYNEGVYVYRITYSCGGEGTTELVGDLLLIRN